MLLNGQAIADKYGVNGFPAFFLIDQQEKIIYANAGFDPSIQSEIEKNDKKGAVKN